MNLLPTIHLPTLHNIQGFFSIRQMWERFPEEKKSLKTFVVKGFTKQFYTVLVIIEDLSQGKHTRVKDDYVVFPSLLPQGPSGDQGAAGPAGPSGPRVSNMPTCFKYSMSKTPFMSYGAGRCNSNGTCMQCISWVFFICQNGTWNFSFIGILEIVKQSSRPLSLVSSNAQQMQNGLETN